MNVVGLSRNLLLLPLLKARPTMTGASDPAVSDLSITPNGSSGARLALASSKDVRDRDENPVVMQWTFPWWRVDL